MRAAYVRVIAYGPLPIRLHHARYVVTKVHTVALMANYAVQFKGVYLPASGDGERRRERQLVHEFRRGKSAAIGHVGALVAHDVDGEEFRCCLEAGLLDEALALVFAFLTGGFDLVLCEVSTDNGGKRNRLFPIADGVLGVQRDVLLMAGRDGLELALGAGENGRICSLEDIMDDIIGRGGRGRRGLGLLLVPARR